MKSLATLLRVKQREMDVLKRQQVLLETQRDDTKKRIEKLAQQLLDELKSAESMPEMAHFFGDFSITIKKRQEQLHKHLQKLEMELDKLAAQIFERFSEMKKYELTMEAAKKRHDDAMARSAQQRMDEIALRGYIRKDGS